ncbi:hypothetical protein [Pseudonocardia zijingensis]|uniref:ABC transporter permease n=1 Tax=Pseudonocardia zijingensis TaxID=153376 RepID=A0ABN1N975_9PSEU
MIWLVWRRQRAALLTAAGIVAACCIVLVGGRAALVAHLLEHGLAERCIDAPSEACRSTATTALMGSEPVTFAVFLGPSELVLLAVPLVVGLLAGIGLFQRELDEGTDVLALTQSVSVTRWWATGLLVAGVPVVLLLVPLGLVAGWAYTPFELIHSFSPLETPLFESSGLAPIAYGVLAFALAAGTGLVARGNLAPAVVAVSGYVVVMFVLATVARPQYLPAETVRLAIDFTRPDAAIRDVPGWTLGRRWVDAQGAPRINTGCGDGSRPLGQCLRDAGISGYEVRTQPNSRYWVFQLIETAILLALSAVALTLTHPRLVSRVKDRIDLLGR